MSIKEEINNLIKKSASERISSILKDSDIEFKNATSKVASQLYFEDLVKHLTIEFFLLHLEVK